MASRQIPKVELSNAPALWLARTHDYEQRSVFLNFLYGRFLIPRKRLRVPREAVTEPAKLPGRGSKLSCEEKIKTIRLISELICCTNQNSQRTRRTKPTLCPTLKHEWKGKMMHHYSNLVSMFKTVFDLYIS